jgi:hypothetical protein
MLRVSLLVLALAPMAAAHAAEGSLVLVGDLDEAAAEGLRRDAGAHAFDVVALAPTGDATAEEALVAVRPLYRDMAFARAAQRLIADEAALLRDRLPTPPTLRALAELEVWLGACLLLDGKSSDAGEHLELARRLEATVEPDPIFPPEVRVALARAATAAAAATPLPIAARLAPTGARLWLDGRLTGDAPTATPGLHYIVVERADRRPFARVMRLTRAAPQIAVSLVETAPPEQALRQAAARVRDGRLGADEGLAVAARLGRGLDVVGAGGVDRFDAADAAQPIAHAEVAVGERAIDAVCRIDRSCARSSPPATDRARRPWYRRAAFWVPVGAGALILVGVGVLAGTLANTSSDYVVRVR